MEKIVKIDGKEIKFKSTGAFLLRYKAQFHKDAIQDIYKMKNAVNAEGELEDIGALDLELFYNLIWTLAKTANPEIEPPMEWLDTFSEFPLVDIIPEVIEMINSCLTTNVKSQKK